MELKIDVNDSNCMTVDEVMKKIAESQGWKVIRKWPDACGSFQVKVDDGRTGTYDVVGDELELDDSELGALFSDNDDNAWYCGQSLLEFLNCSTAIWGENEEGEYFLYTE